MNQFKNIVTSENNKLLRSCTLVSMIDNTVVKYMKLTFVGDNQAIRYGIGNLWIEAYEYDYLHKCLRPNITFNVTDDDPLYDVFMSFNESLNGKIVDKADMDYESGYTMSSNINKDGSVSINFNYKYNDIPECDKVKIVTDYQYIDEDVYNALLNLYCDLDDIAINREIKKTELA